MSEFFVIVVGYDQQVKCQVLNAMAGQKDKFHHFSCRRSAIVKPVNYLTIGGHSMILVQTPCLGSPGWKKVEADFRESLHWTTSERMFFYLKTEPSNVDDKTSIKDLQDKFGIELVRIVVCYTKKSKERSELQIDVDTGQYPFHLDSSFEMQKLQSQAHLEQLVNKKIQSPKVSQVGADKSFANSVPIQSPQERQESIDNVSTVDVTDQATGPGNMPLKEEKLSKEDWNMFVQTLRHGSARSNHLRVNVVGNHGVGKTTLIKRLLQQEVNCDNPDYACTENLEVHHLVARCMERNGEKVWEHGSSDTFLDDLNIQRMAQAMIETEKCQEAYSTTSVAKRIEVEAEYNEEKDTNKSPKSSLTISVAQSIEVEAARNREEDIEISQTHCFTKSVAHNLEIEAAKHRGKDIETSQTHSLTTTVAHSLEIEAAKNRENDIETSPKHSLISSEVQCLEIERETNEQKDTETSPDSSSTANVAMGLEVGSDYIEDVSLETKQNTDAKSPTPFDNLTKQEEKKDYLKKVLYCKKQLQKDNFEKQYVSYWDFAGQAAYYATHQLFMSPSAVYLVVIDLMKDLDDDVTDNLEFRSGILQSCTVKEALKYWIHTVQAYTMDTNNAHAPIIIVGTHKGDANNYMRKFGVIREMFETNFECVAVENSTELKKDEDLRTLQKMIIDNGLGVIDNKVSTQWINLEYDMELRCEQNRDKYLNFSDVQRLDLEMDLPMRDVSRLEAFLCCQHYKGKLLYYNHTDLKDLVITDPMLLVKYLNLLLRRTDKGAVSTHGWNENGILNESYLQAIADKLEVDTHVSMRMVKILVNLNILHPLPSENEDKYFLPCLLSDIPKRFHSKDEEGTRSSLFQIRSITSNFDSIHQTTYHQIICALLQMVPLIEENNEKLIYNLGANFDLDRNNFHWLTFYWNECRLNFYVKDFEEEKEKPMHQYVDEAMELLENAIEEVLTANQHGNVEWGFYVECPKHRGCFLPLDKLKENDKAMCSKRHKVKTSDISCITQCQPETKAENPAMKQKPSDSLLARLAWKLKMLNGTPQCLAVLLKMQCAFVKADLATRDNNEPGTDILCLLRSWRNKLKSNSTSQLLKLLCKRDSFDRSCLEEAMFKPVKTDTRLDNIPEDATVGNKDIVIISDHLSNGLTFVLIELGVKMEEVAQERRNHFDDTKAMTRELLHRWRARKNVNATLRAVLEAMRMFELPLDPVLKALSSATRPQYTETHF